MTSQSNSKVIGLLIKADENWFNSIESLYTKKFIDYVNYWTLSSGNKPVNLKDGDPIYIYTQTSVKNFILVKAKGEFRSKIFNIDKKILEEDNEISQQDKNFLYLDSNRIMTVRQSYDLYGPSNGSVSYGGYLNLLQNYANQNQKNKIIYDNYIIGSTIITDLDFTPKIYELMNGTNNACGFRYISNIQGDKIFFV